MDLLIKPLRHAAMDLAMLMYCPAWGSERAAGAAAAAASPLLASLTGAAETAPLKLA